MTRFGNAKDYEWPYIFEDFERDECYRDHLVDLFGNHRADLARQCASFFSLAGRKLVREKRRRLPKARDQTHATGSHRVGTRQSEGRHPQLQRVVQWQSAQDEAPGLRTGLPRRAWFPSGSLDGTRGFGDGQIGIRIRSCQKTTCWRTLPPKDRHQSHPPPQSHWTCLPIPTKTHLEKISAITYSKKSDRRQMELSTSEPRHDSFLVIALSPYTSHHPN